MNRKRMEAYTVRSMNWREAIRAAAATARERQRNALDSIGKFGDAHAAETKGRAFAFGVIADELDWIADERRNPREALKDLRGWLRSAEERRAKSTADYAISTGAVDPTPGRGST